MTVKSEAQKWLAEAIQHHQAGQLVEAERLYKRVLDADPGSAEALHLLGVMAEQTDQPALSLQLIDAALEITPDNAQFHYSRGIALQRADNPAEAAVAYRHAIEHRPGYLNAMENLAVALADIGDDIQGELICREVLQLAPDSSIAHQNLGTLLLGQGRRKSAVGHFNRLLALNPADATARAKRYQILLSGERFQEGYADYRWRHHSADFSGPSPPRLMPLPSLGEREIKGRKLLIVPEQGVGDEILFASGLTAVLASAASVVLLADPRLIPLLQRSFPTLHVRPTSTAERCDWPAGIDTTWLRCEAGDLPRIAFGDARPAPAAYLRPDPIRVGHWHDKLAMLPGRHIGIAWRGGADSRAQRARSISLEDLIPLMDLPDTSFVNLQYAGRNHDLSAEIRDFNASRGAGTKLIELEDLDTMNDLDEMAALAQALDFVVTVDSAIAHLAAAVGTETCVLVPPNNDWRWFDEIDSSPWYVNATVWRRPADQDWASTIQAMTEWLKSAATEATTITAMPDDNLTDIRTTGNIADEAPAAEISDTALILNDTSAWYHWGCSCTSIALNEGLRASHGKVISCALLQNLRGEMLPQSIDAFASAVLFKRFRRANGWVIDAMENADSIVINGEGTIHGLTEQAVGLLYLAWIGANRLGRAVHIVNHSVYPLDNGNADEMNTISIYREVYECVQKIVVREPASQAVMDALGIPSTLGFDCLPLFADQHGPDIEENGQPVKHIVIAGSVLLSPARIALFADLIANLSNDGYRFSVLLGARGYPAVDDAKFASALYSAAAGNLDIVLATSEFDWLRQIGNASLLVSGRFHHSIAAACMRTPFAVVSSNTPKITGLMQILSEQSPNPENFQVIQEQGDALIAAVRNRLVAPEEFVLDDAARSLLRNLARANFAGPGHDRVVRP